MKEQRNKKEKTRIERGDDVILLNTSCTHLNRRRELIKKKEKIGERRMRIQDEFV